MTNENNNDYLYVVKPQCIVRETRHEAIGVVVELKTEHDWVPNQNIVAVEEGTELYDAALALYETRDSSLFYKIEALRELFEDEAND